MFDDDGEKLIAIYQVTFCAGAPVLDVTIIMTQDRLNSDLAFTVASDAKQYVVNDLALSVAMTYAKSGCEMPHGMDQQHVSVVAAADAPTFIRRH